MTWALVYLLFSWSYDDVSDSVEWPEGLFVKVLFHPRSGLLVRPQFQRVVRNLQEGQAVRETDGEGSYCREGEKRPLGADEPKTGNLALFLVLLINSVIHRTAARPT